jgi:hypothetical protein
MNFSLGKALLTAYEADNAHMPIFEKEVFLAVFFNSTRGHLPGCGPQPKGLCLEYHRFYNRFNVYGTLGP